MPLETGEGDHEDSDHDFITCVVNNTMSEQPEGSEHNSAWVPPSYVVANAAKSARRAQRGGSMADGERVDLLVRTQLVQRQLVLLYIPGYILVLSSPWCLERARTEGRHMICSDAKVDTVTGERSKWSTIRRRSPYAGGLFTFQNTLATSPLATDLRHYPSLRSLDLAPRE